MTPSDGYGRRQVTAILSGLLLATFVASLDMTVVTAAHVPDRREPGRARRAGVGDDRVPDHLDGLHPGLRQAVGHPRAQAAVRHRDHGVPGRVGAVRVRRLDADAGRLPRRRGHRGRRHPGADLGRPGGRGPSPGAREVRRLLRRHLRRGQRGRPGDRRRDGRPAHAAGRGRLAVDLPDQRPGRRRRLRGRDPGAASRPAATAAAPRRPGRHADPDRRGGPAAAGRVARAGLGLGRARVGGLLRDRDAGHRRVPARGAARGRRRAADAAAVPQPRVRRRGRAVAGLGHRGLREHRLASAVPAARPGILAHRRGPADAAAGRRHPRLLGDRRPVHLADRPLQDPPGDGGGPAAGRACSCSGR